MSNPRIATAKKSTRVRSLLIVAGCLGIVGIALAPTLKRSLDDARKMDAQSDSILATRQQADKSGEELSTAKNAVVASPNDIGAHLKLASLLGQDRKYAEAHAELQAAQNLDPKRVETLLALAQVYVAQFYYDRSLELQRKAIELEPNNARAISDLGYSYVANGWDKLAQDLLDRAIERIPANPNLLTVRAFQRHQAQNYQGALQDILAALKLQSDNPRLFGPLIDVYNQLGQNDQAVKSADKAIEKERDNPLYYTGKARALRSLGRFSDAEIAATQAVKLAPDNVEALYERALASKKQGHIKIAQEMFEKVLSINKSYQSANILLAQIYRDQGRRAEADLLIQESKRSVPAQERSIQLSVRVARNPEDAKGHLRLGEAYIERKMHPRAVVELLESLRLAPADHSPIKPLLTALRGMGRIEEAKDIERTGQATPFAK